MPGSWIRIVFDECRGMIPHPLDPKGQGSVVLGGYSLYEYSADLLSIKTAPDPDDPSQSRIRVVDYSGEVTVLPLTRVAQLGFGEIEGFDPCSGPIPVAPTTWSRLKLLYGYRH